jgi:hypothetical protein
VLAVAALAGALDPSLTAAAAPWPFVVALLAFGMPHGAADWAVAARLSGRSGLGPRLLGFTGYLALMAASLAVLAWQPGVTALLFLGLTIFHFGMADATAVGADDDGPVARWGLVLGRGLLLLATAFAAHPAEAWAPFARIGDALSPWAASTWRPDLGQLQRLAVVGAGAGAVLAACRAVARARAGHARSSPPSPRPPTPSSPSARSSWACTPSGTRAGSRTRRRSSSRPRASDGGCCGCTSSAFP